MNPPAALTAASVVGYLDGRGVLQRAADAHARRLSGGVSHAVFAVWEPTGAVVVKQALPRLAVSADWRADPGRVVSEAEALRVLGAILPGHVPEVLDLDPDRHVMTVRHAPSGWADWKSGLMAGQVRQDVAAWLGVVLGRWQLETSQPDSLPERLHDRHAFEQLRTRPFLEEVRARHPALAGPIDELIGRLRSPGACLVHGDYSPKNVLVPPDRPEGWVIDLECAHVGDRAYDVAFLLSHLVLKMLHLPEAAGGLRASAWAFLEAYRDSAGSFASGSQEIVGHLGGLLLARVDGKSPAPYLRPHEADRARRLGADLLSSTDVALDDLLERLEGAPA